MKITSILYWQWHSFLKTGVERALRQIASEVEVFSYQLSDWENDDAFREQFRAALSKKSYDAVFSVNFNPMISMLCQEKGVLYISWVYDSPIHIRDLTPLRNEVNRTFFFDRGEAEAFSAEGYPVLHHPLAGDTIAFRKTIDMASRSERQSYQSEISFVGQLYRTEYDYYLSPLTAYQRGFLEGTISSQGKVYGGYFISELLNEELLAGLNERYREASGGTASISKRELMYLLAQEVTRRERFLALSLLSGRYLVDLYSADDDERLPKRVVGGQTGCLRHSYIDYYTKMPLVFAGTEINLNISLKCIRTGVPLRVFDVLSCAGFLITNFQAELPELFEIGEEVVCYGSIGELAELIDFYRKHDGERRRIAENGRRRIERDYTPEKQLQKIFEKI